MLQAKFCDELGDLPKENVIIKLNKDRELLKKVAYCQPVLSALEDVGFKFKKNEIDREAL